MASPRTKHILIARNEFETNFPMIMNKKTHQGNSFATLPHFNRTLIGDTWRDDYGTILYRYDIGSHRKRNKPNMCDI